MIGRFEWHITCSLDWAPVVKPLAEDSGWTFSQISGCPLLGKGTYCYVTGYHTDSFEAGYDMFKMLDILKNRSVEVLRSKIEDVVYDTKTNVNRIGLTNEQRLI